MAQINKKQIIALRTAASKVFSDDEFREFLAFNFDGVLSTKDLDSEQASVAITLLSNQIGYTGRDATHRVSTNKRAYGIGKKGRAAGRITQAQAEKINGLCELLGWEIDGKEILRFVERQTGSMKSVSWLLNYQASKVIVGMQKVIAAGDKALYDFLNNLTSADMKNAGVQETLNHVKRRLAK